MQPQEEEFKKLSNEEQLYRIRHSFAHVMAKAVLTIFPEGKPAIGPPIKNGFYYDFDLPRSLSEDDLRTIERIMQELLQKEESAFTRKTHRYEEILELYREEPYKRELIEELKDEAEISTYTVYDFVDLCRGPHVPSTKYLNTKAFKLLSVAGAYWRGDETRPMLQRIYATAWSNPKDLRTHLTWLKEVEKRDHRKLGKKLDLFSIHDDAGAGLIYWHPKGARIRVTVEDYWRERHLQNGYDLLYTPHVGKSWLWEKSGHLEFYKEYMYSPMELDSSNYFAKPMNCPFHILIYQNKMRSYRELPLRWAELGTVYRYERAGVLHGLLRVRGFTQDDAHIFCTPQQIETEIKETLRFSYSIWKDLGFTDIRAFLATKPEKAVGESKDWDRVSAALKKALIEENLEFEIDEGGGAFYGPKIDLKIKDAIGREWQMTTIQFDFNLPERFNLSYIDSDGEKKRPYMVHRALLGSMERFFGVLIEHYSGAFPVWLAPVQVCIIPILEKQIPFAQKYAELLRKEKLFVSIDAGNERLGSRIRSAQLNKVPYMLVIGEKEEAEGCAACRTRTGEQLGTFTPEAFASFIKNKIQKKELL